MARRIRLPGIVDVVLVSDPAEIRAFNDARGVDRNFVLRGPLINRLIVARIRHWFQIMGQLLPSLMPRHDHVRADHQQKLAAAVDPMSSNKLWSDSQIDALAAYVRGGGTDEAAGIVAQQIVGSLFDPLYHADGDLECRETDRSVSRRHLADSNRVAAHRTAAPCARSFG